MVWNSIRGMIFEDADSAEGTVKALKDAKQAKQDITPIQPVAPAAPIKHKPVRPKSTEVPVPHAINEELAVMLRASAFSQPLVLARNAFVTLKDFIPAEDKRWQAAMSTAGIDAASLTNECQSAMQSLDKQLEEYTVSVEKEREAAVMEKTTIANALKTKAEDMERVREALREQLASLDTALIDIDTDIADAEGEVEDASLPFTQKIGVFAATVDAICLDLTNQINHISK